MKRALLALLAALTLVACGRGQARPGPGPAASGAVAPSSAPLRYIIGGDSRQDDAHVVIWAFHEAKARGASAFVFLGDMELSADLDEHFNAQCAALAPIRFLPVLGNHEAAHHKYGEDPPREARERALQAYAARFLAGGHERPQSAFSDKLVYSVDLPGGVHLVALDNVSQCGFGADQLAWLGADLARASAGAKHIVVGMHKALAGNGVTDHAMGEDGPTGVADSAAALSLFEKAHVELIVASHFHAFAEFAQRGIRSFITGGMGAPLAKPKGNDAAFHHVLAVTVPAEGQLAVEVVRFPGAPVMEKAKEEER